jgi:subtilisin family serine protease
VLAALTLGAPAARAATEVPAVGLDRLGPAARAHRTARGDRLLVRFPPSAPAPGLPHGARQLSGGWWRVPLGAGETLDGALARWSALPGVDRVEVDAIHRFDPPAAAPVAAATAGDVFVPDDPLFPQQWHHRVVEAEAAWTTARGEGVVVAVIDSGVSTGGKDLACAPLAGEYDAVGDVEGPGAAADVHGHGTFIAGIVAQCTDNGVGAAGLAHGARLLAIRACTADAECAASDVARSIDWATEHGAGVITLSLGFACDGFDWPACSTAIENDAIARAAAAGVVITAIAGNGAQDHLGFPANHPDVLGVGGVDARLLRASYSSWGSALSVVAPSGDTDKDDDGDGHDDGILQETLGRICIPALSYAYCRWQGTSFAGPHVAAAAALLRSAHPQANRFQIRRAIEESALDRGAPGFDAIYGHGLLQAAAALERLGTILESDPASCTPSPERLCLGGAPDTGGTAGDRFAVDVEWRDFAANEGRGRAVPFTADSGLFWFFAPANLEVLVKVLDGCGLNQRHWVFAAATTSVEYRLRVTDTATGAVRVYENVLGVSSPAVTDTAAFPCP